MSRLTKSVLAVLIALVSICILPYILVLLLSSQDFTEYLSKDLGISNSEFVELSINYCSLSVSLLLGVVVYFQSQRINDLEMTQYSTFVGAEDVDYSVNLGNFLFSEQNQTGLTLSHNFSSQKKVILAGVNLIRKGPSKTIVIPLVFITKNQPLIVSLDFKKVHVALFHDNEELYSGEFISNSAPLYTLLGDESRFIVGFGMLLSKDWEVDKIKLNFSIQLKDQNEANKKIKLAVVLQKIGSSPKYYLVSSKSL